MDAKEIEQLTSLSGQPLEVALVDQAGKVVFLKLAPLEGMDWVEARQALTKERWKQFIVTSREEPLDSDTKARTLAYIGTTPVSRSDFIADSEWQLHILELAARRGGFKGNWLGFIRSLRSEDVGELANKLVVLAGFTGGEGRGDKVPLDHTTNTT